MFEGGSKWIMVGVVLAGVLGCQHTPLAQDEPLLPYPQVEGRLSSLVFDAPQRWVALDTDPQRLLEPWYVSRNDVRLTAFAGYQSVTTDQTVNVTYDRQSISGGRSRDHYLSTTYRQAVTQTVR